MRGCDKAKEMFVSWSVAPIYRCPWSYDPIIHEAVVMWADWKAGLRFQNVDIMELPAFVKQALIRCENAAAEFHEEQRRAQGGGTATSATDATGGVERALGPGKYKRLS